MNLRNKNFTRLSVLTAIMGTTTGYKSLQARETEKPNVIVILVDDQGYGGVSCYPHIKPISTPNIDALATGGVRFTQGYTSGHYSSPTRAGLLTGKYQQSFGFYGLSDPPVGGIPADQTIISQYLQGAGYRTAAIGKWHVGDQVRNHPNNRGFEYFYGFIDGLHDYFDPIIGGSWSGWHNGLAFTLENSEPVVEMDYATYEYTARAVNFIDKHSSEPFFIYLPYNAIHSPLQAPADLVAKFARNPEKPTKEEMVQAMTLAVDKGVGQIVDKLEEKGIRDNTLVVYLSDNGGNGGIEPSDVWELRGHKGSYYEGGIRVPFIVSWPGRIPGGRVIDEPVISIDIAPTIMAAAGLKQSDMQGTDLMPYLTGKASGTIHNVLYWSVEKESDTYPASNEFAVRQGKWKLVSDPKQVKECNLYDIEADPQELHGLKEVHPEKYEELFSLYLRWIDKMEVGMVHNGTMRASGVQMMNKYQRNYKKRFGRTPRLTITDKNAPEQGPNER